MVDELNISELYIRVGRVCRHNGCLSPSMAVVEIEIYIP